MPRIMSVLAPGQQVRLLLRRQLSPQIGWAGHGGQDSDSDAEVEVWSPGFSRLELANLHARDLSRPSPEGGKPTGKNRRASGVRKPDRLKPGLQTSKSSIRRRYS